MPLTDEELRAADCVIIVTDHSEIDYKRVCSLAPLIVDTRNALNGDMRRESSARIIRLYDATKGTRALGTNDIKAQNRILCLLCLVVA